VLHTLPTTTIALLLLLLLFLFILEIETQATFESSLVVEIKPSKQEPQVLVVVVQANLCNTSQEVATLHATVLTQATTPNNVCINKVGLLIAIALFIVDVVVDTNNETSFSLGVEVDVDDDG
jgi:hypothetical protein